jgi:hypothetical protein
LLCLCLFLWVGFTHSSCSLLCCLFVFVVSLACVRISRSSRAVHVNVLFQSEFCNSDIFFRCVWDFFFQITSTRQERFDSDPFPFRSHVCMYFLPLLCLKRKPNSRNEASVNGVSRDFFRYVNQDHSFFIFYGS